MKITHVTTRVLSTPADNPLVVGLPAPTETREFVTLELGTDQGLVGIGLTFFGGALTPALRAAVDGLARLTLGEDPARVEAIAATLRRAAGGSGPGGIFTLALSAIDLACWDLRGKALGRSVRPHPVDYLARPGPRLRDMRFRQMKMQCGSEPTVAASVERVRVVREAIGPGLAHVADALTTPVAAGEYHYGIVPFRHLLEARSVDVVMIDVLRVGGITQWMKVAGTARSPTASPSSTCRGRYG